MLNRFDSPAYTAYIEAGRQIRLSARPLVCRTCQGPTRQVSEDMIVCDNPDCTMYESDTDLIEMSDA